MKRSQILLARSKANGQVGSAVGLVGSSLAAGSVGASPLATGSAVQKPAIPTAENADQLKVPIVKPQTEPSVNDSATKKPVPPKGLTSIQAKLLARRQQAGNDLLCLKPGTPSSSSSGPTKATLSLHPVKRRKKGGEDDNSDEEKNATEDVDEGNGGGSGVVTEGSKNGPGKIKLFSKPALKSKPAANPYSGGEVKGPSTNSKDVKERYFSVLYCAKSRKKHKSYLDGILIAGNQMCTLKTTEDKVVTKRLFGSSTAHFGAGSEIALGNWECEVQSIIKEDDYLSGRIFIGVQAEGGEVNPNIPKQKPLAAHKAKIKEKQATAAAAASALTLAVGAPMVARASPGVSARPSHDLTSSEVLLLNKRAYESGKENPVYVEAFLAQRLRPHQQQGVQFMYDCMMGVKARGFYGCILADEMGLGKTVQTISLIYTLLRSSPKGGGPIVQKAIVVCPATLIQNWENEFRTWLGSNRCQPVVISSSAPQEQQKELVSSFANPCSVFQVLILSYELLRKHISYIQKIESGIIACDEGHRLKNSAGSKTMKALTSLPIKRRIILTGTPVQNNLMEFYSMVDFINPTILGSTACFKGTFENCISKGRDASASSKEKAIGDARSQELWKLTANFVLRRTHDVLRKYLPPKTELVVFCPLTALQSSLYRSLVKSKVVAHLLRASNSRQDNSTALSCITALKKVCNHPSLVYEECKATWDRYSALLAKATNKEDGGTKSSLHPNSNSNNENSTNSNTAGQQFNSKFKLALASARSEKAIQEVCLTAAEEESIFSVEAWKCFPNQYDIKQENIAHSSKLVCLFHILQAVRANNEKVVVVSNYRSTLNIIESVCQAQKFGFYRLDGKTPADRRQFLVNAWNAPTLNGTGIPEKFIFMLSARAGGVGLNLIGGNRLVLFDPDWNPATDLQAMGRVWRDGQKKEVFVYRLLAVATVDEKTFQRQLRKQEVATSVVDGSKEEVQRGFTNKDMKQLFVFKDNTACETYDVLSASKKTDTANRTASRKAKAKASTDSNSDSDDNLEVGNKEEIEELKSAFDQFQYWDNPAKCPDSILKGVSERTVSFVFTTHTSTASSTTTSSSPVSTSSDLPEPASSTGEGNIEAAMDFDDDDDGALGIETAIIPTEEGTGPFDDPDGELVDEDGCPIDPLQPDNGDQIPAAETNALPPVSKNHKRLRKSLVIDEDDDDDSATNANETNVEPASTSLDTSKPDVSNSTQTPLAPAPTSRVGEMTFDDVDDLDLAM